MQGKRRNIARTTAAQHLVYLDGVQLSCITFIDSYDSMSPDPHSLAIAWDLAPTRQLTWNHPAAALPHSPCRVKMPPSPRNLCYSSPCWGSLTHCLSPPHSWPLRSQHPSSGLCRVQSTHWCEISSQATHFWWVKQEVKIDEPYVSLQV